jgi:hypothetical protein
VFDFTSQASGVVDRPLRQEAGMNHEVGAFVMVQWLPPEPLQQLSPIVGGEDVVDRVFRPHGDDLFRYSQQEQIVIAQDDPYGGAKLFEVAKDAKGVRATIDQIADGPQAISGRIKPDLFE